MPGLKQDQLQSYVTQVLEAVVRRDKAALRLYGQRDGFINDRIRRLVWPCLLDCEDIEYSLYDDGLGFPDLDERDILTIQQDVRRSFTRFPDLDEKKRGVFEERLEKTIARILRIHPRLHYVQGFHDLAEVLILVLDDDKLVCHLLHRLSLINIRDMLLPSLDPVLNSLDIIPAILQKVDKRLYRRVLKAIRPPHFAASAVMTWFSHELDDMDNVATIFDFLLSSPSTMIFYLVAAVPHLRIIINSKPEILAPYEPDEDDFTVIYSRLVSIFRKQVSVTIIFALALRLHKQVPPQSLGIYKSLSQWSCYKTVLPDGMDWVVQGGEWLDKATEEQYAQKQDETQTESTRRQNTFSRQQEAGELLQRILDTEKKMDGPSEEERRRHVEMVKETTLKEEEWKWTEREEKRKKIEEDERERLSRVRQVQGGEWSGMHGVEDVREFLDVYGLTSLGVAVGIVAIAGAVFAIMNASR